MIISVASGKGGTGKTTVAVSLALTLSEVQILDCDVEEPNVHIFLKPKIAAQESVLMPIPQVDFQICTYCGQCAEVCQFNAIVVVPKKVLVLPELCHGCGACGLACPEKAIKEVPREIGIVEEGASNGIAFVQGRLNIAEPISAVVVKAVKKKINNQKTVLIDASPGTACPVVEAIKGSDLCVLVTEPTPFGLADLKLAVEVAEKLKVPCGVVINRADIGDQSVEQFCQEHRIPIILRLSFDRKVAEAYSQGVPAIQAIPELREKFRALWAEIETLVRK